MGPHAQDAGRPGKLAVAVGFLRLLQARSTCKRARVAAIITDKDFRIIYAMGYNGPARGEDNDTCRNEKGNCGCVHAEANALVKLRTAEKDLALFSATAPCELCARLIVNSGAVSGVLYLEDYRSTLGVKILQAANIVVGQLEEDSERPHQKYGVTVHIDYHWVTTE